MFIEFLHKNWPPHHSPCFLSPFVTSNGSLKCPFSTLPLENFDKVQRYSELLYLDGLCHHICWILFHADLYQIDHLIIPDPLMYIVIPHINVLCPLCDTCDPWQDESHSGCRNESELNSL